MKIRIPYFLIVFLLLISGSLFAKKVDISQAKDVAKNCYYEKINTISKLDYDSIGISESFTIEDETEPVYYVFNFSNHGFVIVAADDIVYPIIGYSLEKNYSSTNQPENFVNWMEHYKKEIVYSRKIKAVSNDDINAQWSHYQAKPETINKGGAKAVTPLIPCTWDQGEYYNRLCPADNAGPGGRVYTGCVATAMAMVMYYYRFPATGVGTHSYNAGTYGTLTVNPGTTTYDWNAMNDNLINNNIAVATLIYHCGVTVDMNYGTAGSGSTLLAGASALQNYFRYGIVAENERDLFTDPEWIAILATDLDAKRPVLYSGDDTGGDGAHAFICDGYDVSNNFHFNWGWGGYYNGYFAISDLNPGTDHFNDSQRAYTNIYPGSGYPNNCTGQVSITSQTGTIEDGSGPSDYQNNDDCRWLIAPPGASKVTLYFTAFNTEAANDKVIIYNGGTITDPILATYSGSSLPATVSSTGGQMLVRFITNGSTTSSGWRTHYISNYPALCSTSTDLLTTTGNFSDGSGTANYNVSANCKWNIKPTGANVITLGFTTFDTEADYDKVKVYDIGQTPPLLLATYSGTTLPPTQTYNTTKLMVWFTSNTSVNGQGWDAYYNSTDGIDENEILNSLNVFPNPAENILNVNFSISTPQNILLTLSTITGQAIYTQQIDSFTGTYSKTIDLTDISKGIYLLKVVGEKGTVNKKVVIE